MRKNTDLLNLDLYPNLTEDMKWLLRQLNKEYDAIFENKHPVFRRLANLTSEELAALDEKVKRQVEGLE